MLHSFIVGIIIYFSIILITSSPFQNNNLFYDNFNHPFSSTIQPVNAEKDDDEKDDDEKDDDEKDDDEKDATINVNDDKEEDNNDNNRENDNKDKDDKGIS